MTEAEKVAYAPWWARTAAWVADNVVLIVVLALIQEMIEGAQLQNIIYQSCLALYFILLEGSRRQASLGKSLLKIHIAMDDGSPASFLRIAMRYLIWTFFGLPMIAVTVSASFGHFADTLQRLQAAGGDAAVSYLHKGEGHVMLATLVVSFFIYVIPSLILYWIPMIYTRQKIGLHDFMTRTRVYKRLA